MHTTLILDLEAELEQLQRRRACALTRGAELLERADSHLGHNLAACAADITEVDGQIKSTRAIIAHVKGLQPEAK